MILKQTGPVWGHLPLGYGPATIGEAGCLLTTFAQMLLHYGYAVNPATLNQTLKDDGRWVQGDLLADAAVSGLPQFPNVKFVVKWDFTNRPADLSVLNNTPQDEFIIEVDFDHNPNDGLQTHFVRFVSWDGQKLIIDDPEYGSEENFTDHYGTNLAQTILKIVKYTGPVVETAPPAASPAVPAAFADSYEALTGTAHANVVANVRTGPGTSFPLATEHTPGGKLQPGIDFVISGQIQAQDPYGDGRNKWVRSEYGNWVWEGNLTLHIQAANGGADGTSTDDPQTGTDTPKQPATDAPATDLPVGDKAGGNTFVDIGRQAWLKPTLNDTTRQHEGAPVIDLATGDPIAVFPMDARAPFVRFTNRDGVNYFVTQHMVDANLNHGIDGLNLEEAAQPGTVIDGVQAAGKTLEEAKADTETVVKDEIDSVGPVWSKLFAFLQKHHPNNK